MRESATLIVDRLGRRRCAASTALASGVVRLLGVRVTTADAREEDQCTSSWSGAAEWEASSPARSSSPATRCQSSTRTDAPSGGCPPASAARRSTGFGFDRDHLAEAGIDEAGAFASVTNGDNSNILCARIARETYGIERVVARIYDPRRALIYQRLGIPTVATVAWTTDQVLRRLLPGRDPPRLGRPDRQGLPRRARRSRHGASARSSACSTSPAASGSPR